MGVAPTRSTEETRRGRIGISHVGPTTKYFRSIPFNAYYYTSLSSTKFNI